MWTARHRPQQLEEPRPGKSCRCWTTPSRTGSAPLIVSRPWLRNSLNRKKQWISAVKYWANNAPQLTPGTQKIRGSVLTRVTDESYKREFVKIDRSPALKWQSSVHTIYFDFNLILCKWRNSTPSSDWTTECQATIYRSRCAESQKNAGMLECRCLHAASLTWDDCEGYTCPHMTWPGNALSPSVAAYQ